MLQMDLEVKYTETSTQLINAYKVKTPRQKYLESELYEHFKILAWESALWRGTDPMPALKQLIPAGKCYSKRSDPAII